MPKIVDGEVVYLSLLELTREMMFENKLREYRLRRDQGALVSIRAVKWGVPDGEEEDAQQYEIDTSLGYPSGFDGGVYVVEMTVTSYPKNYFQRASSLDEAETLLLPDDTMAGLFRFLKELGTFNMHIDKSSEPPTGSRLVSGEKPPESVEHWRESFSICRDTLGAKRYSVDWKNMNAYFHFKGFDILCDFQKKITRFARNGRVVVHDYKKDEAMEAVCSSGVKNYEDLGRLSSLFSEARDKLHLWKRSFEPLGDGATGSNSEQDGSEPVDETEAKASELPPLDLPVLDVVISDGTFIPD